MVQVTREWRPRRTYEAEQMEAYRRRVCNNLAALFVSIAIPRSKKTAICSEGAEGQLLVFTSTVVIRFMPRHEATFTLSMERPKHFANPLNSFQ